MVTNQVRQPSIRDKKAHFPLDKTGRLPASCCGKTSGAELSFSNASTGFPLLNNSMGWPQACPFDLSAYSTQPAFNHANKGCKGWSGNKSTISTEITIFILNY